MATTETMQTPALGEHGEPCQGCGAPLAADQRYCLNCGQRRGGPRVDYRRHMGASPAQAPRQEPQVVGEGTSPSAPRKAERDYAPLAAVGGVAVLGLMLLVGVLIGKGTGTTSSAPAPIVRVGGAGGSTTASADSGKPGATSKKASAGGSAKAGAKQVKGGLAGSAAGKSDATVQASTQDLNGLSSQSGSSYEQQSKKLPDKIATPGKPPPVDTSKPPGGGSGATVIK